MNTTQGSVDEAVFLKENVYEIFFPIQSVEFLLQIELITITSLVLKI
jgi:hypothetical protein